MNLFKSKIIVVTHDGDFHADDVFACASLLLWAQKKGEKLKIIRSREKEDIEKADMAVDVGRIYDPVKNRFDHHQKEGKGERANGIPFSSFGMVWDKYGKEISGSQEIADRIERSLVMPIDARDNGINISTVNELDIKDHRTSDVIGNFNPTVQEDRRSSFKQFEKALYVAKEILIREIIWAKAYMEGEKETLEAIKEQNEPEILILDKNTEWHEIIAKYKKIKLVLYPRKDKNEWGIRVARDNKDDFNSDRVKLPIEWQGLVGEELEKVSGINGALLCARGGWFALTRTKEGAIEMANKALHNLQN